MLINICIRINNKYYYNRDHLVRQDCQEMKEIEETQYVIHFSLKLKICYCVSTG